MNDKIKDKAIIISTNSCFSITTRFIDVICLSIVASSIIILPV